MAGKTYAILGGGGSFGIHAAFYLLDHAQPKKVIGIGRNPLRPEPFSLGMAEREGYVYHARHVTHELDLLLELLDREKPEVIVNFAAQGDGAACRGAHEAPMARTLHSDRDFRDVRLGRARGQGGRAYQAVEPLCRLEGCVRHVSRFRASLPEVSNEHHPAFERLLPRSASASRDSEGHMVRAHRQQAAAARRRPGGEVLHPCPGSWPRHPPGRREGPVWCDL